MTRFVAESGQWCILRTSGARTLPLDRSLLAAGFDSWTPRETKRARLSRGRKRMVERENPMLPTFVFARARHLTELLAICAAETSPHPPFSVFRHAGRFPLIDDAAVDGVREMEALWNMDVAKRTRFVPPVGSRVLISSGPFIGLTGVVESADHKSADVNFGGRLVVKVASWILPEDIVEDRKPERAVPCQRR